MIAAIQNTLAEMTGGDLVAAVAKIDDELDLVGREIDAVQQAVPKRQFEFAAGRRAARRALSQLGCQTLEIPASESRAPEWPEGFTGSITHDNGLAAAVAAQKNPVAFVGIDMAEATPFPDNLRDAILRTDGEEALGGLEARAVFSAKEAIFKALYPSVLQFVGFDATEVFPDLENGVFRARMTETVGIYHKRFEFNGQLRIEQDRLLATIVLDQGDIPVRE